MDANFLQQQKRQEEMKPFLDTMAAVTTPLGICGPEEKLADETPIGVLRRRRRPRVVDDNVAMMTLTEVDGVLQWEVGAGARAPVGRRSRRGGGPILTGEIIAQYKFEKLPPSQVGTFLKTLDDKLTPTIGLRRFDSQQWDGHTWSDNLLAPVLRPSGKKRILIFVHGTFSNSENLLKELVSILEGRALLKRAAKRYDEILTFDHPTLAVSPILNAMDLARLFADCPAAVDVVCHSRGGLVTRWWLEGLGFTATGKRRAVMVGVPMAGTSLAAAPRLRAALGLLTNYGRVLSLATDTAALAMPFLSVASGLMKVVTSITSFGANTPVIDAAVALIPGLAGQSRVGNNEELLRLRYSSGATVPEYYIVRSDFQAPETGWKFWRRFVKWKENLADFGTDIIFEGKNDLVVDTSSMSELADNLFVTEAQRILDFGTTSDVHHTIYFRQAKTIDFIAQSLGI
jgi:hypothetical protein